MRSRRQRHRTWRAGWHESWSEGPVVRHFPDGDLAEVEEVREIRSGPLAGTTLTRWTYRLRGGGYFSGLADSAEEAKERVLERRDQVVKWRRKGAKV